MSDFTPFLMRWLDSGVVIARLARTEGSTPREAGAFMLISADATKGSIGGGQLEFHVTDMAREMLETGEARRVLHLPLGPHMGQCCGGRVTVDLARATPADTTHMLADDRGRSDRRPRIMVFGAGHTGRALVRALALLPFCVTLIDDRETFLADLPAGILAVHDEDPASFLAQTPSNAACVIMTHSHALDFRLTEMALIRNDLAYVGLIGSATKRARFAASFRRAGGAPDRLAHLTCPIGGPATADKRPEIIAALVAAELAVKLAMPSDG